MDSSIILPTYNERENLPKLLAAIARLRLPSWEVVVVDDNSPDGTGALADDLARQYPLRVVHRPGKAGLASAMVAGFVAAHGQYLVVMDADLSHDPTIIPALVERLQSGATVAVGSRFAPGGGMVGWPAWRQFMSRVATGVARLLFRVPARDPMSGYFAVQRSFFASVHPQLHPRGYKLLLEMLVRGKPSRVDEVGFQFQDRQHGKSKISPAVIAAYLRMILDLLWR